MSKARQKQRATARRTAKPAAWDWRAFLIRNPHLAKRIECAIPGEMLLALSHFMANSKKTMDKHVVFANSVIPDLEIAAREAFGGLPNGRAVECCNAMGAACDYAWGLDRRTYTVQLLLISCLEWLNLIEGGGYLLPAEGSAFDRARKVYEDEIEAGRKSKEFGASYEEAMTEALKLVGEIQVRFEDVGLFVGALDYLIEAPATPYPIAAE